ncbi:MAG TPA: hypothetical protein VFD63_14655 [Pyrinomonadaceae bacterium]|nr:hypothetical protein [Pyrinomonadaceae bacterium]
MNCQKFEAIVSELARNQMMDADLRAEALAHTFKCSECSDRMRDQKVLSSGLNALALDMNQLQAPPQLELKLREAFRQSKQVTPFPVRKRSNRRYWLSAVAAMLLIVIGLAVVRAQLKGVQEELAKIPPQSIPVSEIQTPEAPQALQSKQEVIAGNKEKVETPRRRQQSQSFYAANNRKRVTSKNEAVAANHVTREVATDFMPLGYMNASSFQDGGQLVRVELPRSALAKFGIPVNMDRYNEKVKADVLFGADGLAQAIRFVQ